DRIAGPDELREEREVEDRRLRIEDVVEEALRIDAARWREWANVLVRAAETARTSKAEEAEQNEVHGSARLQDGERRGGSRQDCRDADRGRGRVHDEAAADSEARSRGGAPSVRHGAAGDRGPFRAGGQRGHRRGNPGGGGPGHARAKRA